MYAETSNDTQPSVPVLVTLGLFWIGLLTWSAYVAIDLWPRDPDELLNAQITASRSVWAAFGEGMRTALSRMHIVMVATLSAPLLFMTWLALPDRDRRTFPVVLLLWFLGVIAAYNLPMASDGVVFALACVPIVAVAEVLRSVITALVRHGNRPLDSHEASF